MIRGAQSGDDDANGLLLVAVYTAAQLKTALAASATSPAAAEKKD